MPDLKDQIAYNNALDVRRMARLLRRICAHTDHPDYEAAVDAIFKEIEQLKKEFTDLAKLRQAARIINGNDVDPDIQRYLAFTAIQLDNLLATTEVTSSDFNTVKALVEGKVDTFMGFKFIRTERLTTDGNGDRQIIAWAQDGLLLASGSNNITRITERADKSYSVQVFRSEDFGATRMEEDKVVEIACVEA